MATKPKPDSTQAVDEFMSTLDHPFKREIQALREIILGVDPTIAEGIKWKTPSFRTTEYFATTHLRVEDGVGIIFHLGAKVRDLPEAVSMEDPAGSLKWLAKDRAMVTFSDLSDVTARKAMLEQIVRQWIAYV
jgi:hypothetical protein